MACKVAIPIALLCLPAAAQLRVGTFPQEVRTAYTAADGLPDNNILSVTVTRAGAVYVGTASGLARLTGSKWTPLTSGRVDLLAARGEALLYTATGALHELGKSRLADLPPGEPRSLAAGATILLATRAGAFELANGRWQRAGAFDDVRQVAIAADGRAAAAAASGLYLRDPASKDWRALHPQDGARSWAPLDVRAAAFDTLGRLWFADPQGAGCLDKSWKLFTGYQGLPYDDFTTLAAGENGVVWLGTRLGAIRFDGVTWEYRQGLRWLPDDAVRAIAVTPAGDAWFATGKGAARIARRPTTLAEKARFFEDEIDKRHRRTPYGYVLSVALKRPGDAADWTQHDSDNDGLWTAMYGAGECFAYAATRDPLARKRARMAFEALRFLGTVTQGGEHPAPPGFVARTVRPAGGPDPNVYDSRARDEKFRATRDRRWKIMDVRWPRSADEQWYWKTDTSSDELDGHYFFYAQYYDLAAETPEEKQDVRRVVAAITDHLLAHDYALVDWDGKPTRWAIFGPAALNRDVAFWGERGLNSLSIVSYLRVAGHITGDAKYDAAAGRLIRDHAYDINIMVPKMSTGPGSGNQSDDEMAFMSFYDLLKYEKDPRLRQMWCYAFANYWSLERVELNPLFNFLYAGSCTGETFSDAFRANNLSPRGAWLDESVDTLRRYPLDRIDWSLTNSHRKDIVPVPVYAREPGETPGRGYRHNGKVLPIDERFVDHWNHDPYRLDQGGRGLNLADGASFLLPYYLGMYRKYIE